MKASIIVCTRNRAESLRLVLESICREVTASPLKPELLVIDNGSTDHTRAVVGAASVNCEAVRYLHEPRRGQTFARNTGLECARGEAILFTDDDVRVPEGWIDAMCRPILGGDLDAAGGNVRLAEALMRPWLTPIMKTWMVSGSPPVGDLWGANMVFHRKVLSLVRGFDTQLGPGALGFGDDTLFAKQLVGAGFKLGTLDVEVEHHPDPSRLTETDLVRAAVARGQSAAYCAYHWDHKPERFTRSRELMLRARRAIRQGCGASFIHGTSVTCKSIAACKVLNGFIPSATCRVPIVDFPVCRRITNRG